MIIEKNEPFKHKIFDINPCEDWEVVQETIKQAFGHQMNGWVLCECFTQGVFTVVVLADGQAAADVSGDDIRMIDLPSGGAVVAMEGEVVVHTAEEVEDMERDYRKAIERIEGRAQEC
ncbi:hypothetical protein ACFSR7_36295 [Cohnella sp. GCM10020058]|uniref:hypothetical protein n=1 Tax=Cohnella sp. GCM10020058 TaxID=3317330 RepID=UPI00363C4C61